MVRAERARRTGHAINEMDLPLIPSRVLGIIHAFHFSSAHVYLVGTRFSKTKYARACGASGSSDIDSDISYHHYNLTCYLAKQ